MTGGGLFHVEWDFLLFQKSYKSGINPDELDRLKIGIGRNLAGSVNRRSFHQRLYWAANLTIFP